jgi:hypothetical protein
MPAANASRWTVALITRSTRRNAQSGRGRRVVACSVIRWHKERNRSTRRPYVWDSCVDVTRCIPSTWRHAVDRGRYGRAEYCFEASSAGRAQRHVHGSPFVYLLNKPRPSRHLHGEMAVARVAASRSCSRRSGRGTPPGQKPSSPRCARACLWRASALALSVIHSLLFRMARAGCSFPVLCSHYDLHLMQSLGINAPGGLHLVYGSRSALVNLVAELVFKRQCKCLL